MEIVLATIKLFQYLTDLNKKRREEKLKKTQEYLPKIIFQNAVWEKDIVLVHFYEARVKKG